MRSRWYRLPADFVLEVDVTNEEKEGDQPNASSRCSSRKVD